MDKKLEKAKKKTRNRKPGTDDGRRGLRIPQECIDLIVKGISEVKTNAQISRDVAKKFGIPPTTADARVKSVWKALGAEAKLDKPFQRDKVSNALLRIYREATEDMKLENLMALMDEADMDVKQRMRIFSKWDPYKGAGVALRALDQYTKLHGLDAPEKLQIEHSGAVTRPEQLTAAEKRARILELWQKNELKGPVSTVDAKDKAN